jgi:galactokinase
MSSNELEKIAKSGDFCSYVAGTALVLLTEYPTISGLKLSITECDLPVGKGLSSSGAVCVLIAQAFNEVYSLQLSTEKVMDLAYRGERQTGSQCGRMDQGCAYPIQPIVMDFSGEYPSIFPIQLVRDLFFLIVEIGDERKNTLEILRQLNDNLRKDLSSGIGVRRFFNNDHIIEKFIDSIQKGDAEEAGRRMNEFQELFDECLKPVCQELEAPRLHSLLNFASKQPGIYGGKSIGSGGEGSALFIVKDQNTQHRFQQLVMQEFQMMSWKLTLKAQ